MKKLLAFASKKKKLVEKNPSLCAISGGQDSIVTFFLLLHVKKSLNFEILYCQHFWQPKNFLSPKFLLKLSVLFEIPYHISLPQISLITENGSRAWRKKIFIRIARLQNFENLLTGQTLTDNIEVFFHNLLRGTTPKSLRKSTVANYNKTVTSFFSNTNLKSKLINFYIKKTAKRFSTNKKKQTSFLKTGALILSKKTLNSSLQTNLVLKDQRKVSKLKKDFIFLKKKHNLNRSNKNKTYLNFFPLNIDFFTNQNDEKTLFDFSFTEILRKTPKDKKHLNLVVYKKVCSCTFCFYSKYLNLKLIHKKLLLERKRFSISRLVKFYDFPLLTDATNFSTKFTRNKIRYKLSPLIRFLFNKNFENSIKNFLETIELEQKFFQDEIGKIGFLLKNKNLTKKFNSNENLQKWSSKKTSRKKFLVNFIMGKLLFNLQRSIIEKILFNYSEIELTYLQIIYLQNFI